MKTSVIEVRDMLSVLSVLGAEKRIGKVPGVESVTVNYAAGSATVRYDETRLEVADIKSAVHQSGFQSAGESQPKHRSEHKPARNHAVVTAPGAASASASTPKTAAPKAATVAPAAPAVEGQQDKAASRAPPSIPVAAVPKATPIAPADAPEPAAPAVGSQDAQEGHTALGSPPPTPSPAKAKTGRLDDPSLKDADEVARSLGADLDNGLTSQEASRRLAQDGPNELRSAPRRPAWRRVLAHFQDPLIYLLLAAVAIALVAWVVEGLVGWPVDAIVIATIVLLNGVLGYVQEAKAEDAVAALARMTAATSAVLRDGQVLRVPSAELVRGDLLVLGEGDAVGADARLVQVTSLRVQEASLTGESEAVLKDAATLPKAAALGDRLDMVFKGTAVAQGTGRAVVTATGMDTQIGSIAEMLEATAEEPTPLEKEIGRIGRMLGIAVVIIAIVVVGTILLISDIRSAADVMHVLLLGVSLAVAAVPEGLPAILSVVLALGVQRMAKHNAIVKNLSSVETLGSASVIASDKTGTLTRSEMTIERVMTASGGTHVTGVGYVPQGRVEHEGAELAAGPLRDENVVVLSGGSLAGNADLRQGAGGEWEIHGDPTEAAFLVAERKLGVTERRERRFERIGEIPFTSERKMMSTIELDHEHNDEVVVM